MPWPKTIDWYTANGYQMIRLDPNAVVPRDRGKKPLDSGWTTATYPRGQLLAWALRGSLHNLGVRLGGLDLVIDVDPRNGGAEGYGTLLVDSGADLKHLPVVATGGGGLHIYCRLPGPVSLRNELEDYPGVEWKNGPGLQVVAPGSKHPDTGRRYAWLNQPDVVPEIPPALLAFLLERQPVISPSDPTDEAEITPEELAELLTQLPPEAYRTNEAWFKLMAAAYHATGGAGVDEFVAWSISDPEYAEHEERIRRRWRSLERPGHGQRSMGTLVRELRLHGADVPQRLGGAELSDYVATPADALNAAERLGRNSSAAEIREVLRDLRRIDPLDRMTVLDQIRETTGKPRTELKKALDKETGDRKDWDISEEVSKTVLAEFDDGETLTFALDGRYWRYDKTHWVPCSTDQLKGTIKKHAERFRAAHPAAKFQLSAAIQSAEVVLRAGVAGGVDLLGTAKAPEPVVNCSNFELWFTDSGFEKRRHSPGSYLTHCLPIAYDPAAGCPVFDDTLSGIFRPLPDGSDVVRHLWEVFGYTVQPRKWIPSWFLFQGRGANGKSLILDVLIELLGPTARPVAAISELSTARSEFALADCVGALAIIDDDVRRNTVLNDDILKKLSEDKTIRTRFLRENKFTFRNCSTTFLAANSWPQTRDLSDGMMRRAYGFPFRRQFKQDDARKQRILGHEMAGVLNSALAGLERLRARGYFDVPASCKELISEWAAKSNQLLVYLGEHHEGGRWPGYLDFDILWEGYEHWASRNRVQRSYSRPGFKEALLSYGVRETTKGMRGKK